MFLFTFFVLFFCFVYPVSEEKKVPGCKSVQEYLTHGAQHSFTINIDTLFISLKADDVQ